MQIQWLSHFKALWCWLTPTGRFRAKVRKTLNWQFLHLLLFLRFSHQRAGFEPMTEKRSDNWKFKWANFFWNESPDAPIGHDNCQIRLPDFLDSVRNNQSTEIRVSWEMKLFRHSHLCRFVIVVVVVVGVVVVVHWRQKSASQIGRKRKCVSRINGWLLSLWLADKNTFRISNS